MTGLRDRGLWLVGQSAALALLALPACASGPPGAESDRHGAIMTNQEGNSGNHGVTQESMRKVASEALRARGVPDASAAPARLFTEYDLLLDESGKALGVSLSAAGPFAFFYVEAAGDEGVKGPPPPQQAIAVSAAPLKAWTREPGGFEAWVASYQYARHPERIDARRVFLAWYILDKGALPHLVQSARGYGPEIESRVGPPRTTVEGGVAVTTAWTESPMQRDLTEHTIRVFPDGHVEAASRQAVGSGKTR